jgi:isoleucyl-tRNA synthetase
MADMIAKFDSGQPCRVSGHEGDLPPAVFTREKGMAPGFQVVEEGELALALDTRLDEALELEGLARDVVRHLQVLRKDAGLEVTQRVGLGWQTSSGKLRKAISEHQDHIAEELLAIKVVEGDLPGEATRKDFDISGHPLTAAIRPI